ncbi:MAG: FHA domain-containing protein [Chloroflexota bacterium]
MSDVKDTNLTETSTSDSDERPSAESSSTPDKISTQSMPGVPDDSSPDAPATDESPVTEPEASTTDDVETIPVRPDDSVLNKNGQHKPRPGEITEDMLKQRTSTRKLGDTDFEDGDPRWGTARFGKRMLLEIKLRDGDDRFTFDYDDIDEIIIGRRDPHTGQSPAVDLENHGGLNKGVSRKHASIVRRDGALNLVDRGSPNGTFLNGQKLVAEQPRILRDGDDVRLGHLVVRVTFRPADMG